MANAAVVRSKDVLAQAAEIIDAKYGAEEKESKFIRNLRAKGFNPIAVFSPVSFYQILVEFNFRWFQNLDRDDRVPASGLFNVQLSTAISFIFATLAVIVGTGIVGMLAKGFQPLWLAITAVTITHLTYKFNFSNSSMKPDVMNLENLLVLLSFGMFVVAGYGQFVPIGASFFATAGIIIAYGIGTVAIYITAYGWTLHKRFCGYLATQINSRLPMEKLISKLFPNQNDASGNEDLRVKLFFNTDGAFEKTKQRLWSAGYKPCIASVVGGIAVDRDDLRGVYTEREHKFSSAHDPILYLINPSRTEIAVMARSGNFPDEKALLNLARKL